MKVRHPRLKSSNNIIDVKAVDVILILTTVLKCVIVVSIVATCS